MSCKYCRLEHGTKLSHLNRCTFSPRNNKLILDWIRDCYKSGKQITGTSYSDFARENMLPVSNTIFKLFVKNGLMKKGQKITDIFKIIIYRSYALYPDIDLEILDLYIYQDTFGMFGYSATEYLNKVHEVYEKDGLRSNLWEIQYTKLAQEISK